MIEPGRMRNRIAIQSRTATTSETGGVTHTWSTDMTVWGSISPLSGNEPLRADKLLPEVSHRVRIRYRSGITAKNRLVFDSRVFQIVAVLNRDERNIELELLCSEAI